jgi:hypothetical protein
MDSPNDRVKHVLFYVGLRPGHLMLAEMEDGSYCVLRDDHPVDGARWPGGEFVAAAARFEEMKARLLPPRPAV